MKTINISLSIAAFLLMGIGSAMAQGIDWVNYSTSSTSTSVTSNLTSHWDAFAHSQNTIPYGTTGEFTWQVANNSGNKYMGLTANPTTGEIDQINYAIRNISSNLSVWSNGTHISNGSWSYTTGHVFKVSIEEASGNYEVHFYRDQSEIGVPQVIPDNTDLYIVAGFKYATASFNNITSTFGIVPPPSSGGGSGETLEGSGLEVINLNEEYATSLASFQGNDHPRIELVSHTHNGTFQVGVTDGWGYVTGAANSVSGDVVLRQLGEGNSIIYGANASHLFSTGGAQRMIVSNTGLGIGVSSPTVSLEVAGEAKVDELSALKVSIGAQKATGSYSDYALSVDGKVVTKDLVCQNASWADYVFEEGFDLLTLEEVEQFIAANGHLPSVPSAREIETEGLSFAETQKIQMQKIEELTLYVIQLQKQIKALSQD